MSMSRRQLGQMLTAGALRGIPPAGVLSVDDADRLTQASPTPAGSISRKWRTHGVIKKESCWLLLCPHRMVSTARGQWR